MKHIFFILFIYLLCYHVLYSQNEEPICDKVNCTGSCGKYRDINADGICDLGFKIIKKEINIEDEVKDTIDSNITKVKNEINNINNTKSPEDLTKELKKYNVHFNSLLTTKLINIKKRPYNLIEISIVTLILYSLSWLLTKYHLISKRLHKRIWNVLLLISFLISCLLGIILIIQINYGIWEALKLEFLYWHVQVGIVMTLIAMFHVLWHINYFKKIFSRIE
jgi:hypothetical protein